MKLRATIERMEASRYGSFGPAVKLTYPDGKVGAPPERIIERNIGPRPWSEMSYWKDGNNVHIYCK